MLRKGGRNGRLWKIVGTVVTALVLVAFQSLVPPAAFGDSANYYYDGRGRLTRVVKGTSGTLYHYDDLGNLLSVTSSTTTAATPILNSITPNVLFVGSTLFVTISGQNLLSTESVISDNPSLSISNASITDTEITAEMTATSNGAATITVLTPYGTAQLDVILSNSVLKITPGQLGLAPGTSGTLSVSIDPPLTTPLTINLTNSKPEVASVPSTATIPLEGMADFTVDGLQDGVATIGAGSSRSAVIVGPPFAGDVNGLTGGRVSVYIDTPLQGDNSTLARPVCVHIDAPSAGSYSNTSVPVSVHIDTTSTGSTSNTSVPVSVFISPDALLDLPAASVSRPVSIHLATPAAGPFSAMASPVSVHVESSPNSSTSNMATPISVHVDVSSGSSSSNVANPVSVYMDVPADNSSTAVSIPISVEIQ